MSLISQAAQLYREGKYLEAYDLYKKFGNDIGYKIVNVNQLLCLKRFKEKYKEESFNNLYYLCNIIKDKDIQYILYANISINVCDGSSIWYSSMINILSSLGKVLVISANNNENNIILSNVNQSNKIYYIFPYMLGFDKKINIENCIKLIGYLDCILPNLQYIFVRGLEENISLCTNRQFYHRIYSYLTNFYYVKNGISIISDDNKKFVQIIAKNIKCFLVQTEEICRKIKNLVDHSIDTYFLPPPIPQITSLPQNHNSFSNTKSISIGYAGKLSPQWGILQLLIWADKINKIDKKIHITIISNKIQAKYGKVKSFKKVMEYYFQKDFVTHINGMKREDSIKVLSDMDYIWCYRPKGLEEGTLEISTKLVEMASLGSKCICYPNKINKNILGDRYPFYIKNFNDFNRIIDSKISYDFSSVKYNIIKKHSFKNIIKGLNQNIKHINSCCITNKTICFAGHDFKFIDTYISYLKEKGISVLRDIWEWGYTKDQKWSEYCYNNSDIIFCEWGLANAVWYSQRNTLKKDLIIRIHLQEINEKAKKFGSQINIDNVKKIIFVSQRVRDEAIRLWNWPKDKTLVIQNFLLDNEYLLYSKKIGQKISLGMVGIIPTRKRFDRAVDLLEKLLDDNIDVYLYIKGHRPETLAFMQAPGRKHELPYYEQIYSKIEKSSKLKSRVIFEKWGNDVSLWYKKIDFILSCSDFESFHYALADGVLSGCLPIIWPWQESDKIYKKEWIVQDTDMAIDFIKNIMKLKDINSVKKKNRDYLIERYGKDRIFSEIDKILIQ